MEYEVDRGADRKKLNRKYARKKIVKTMAVTALIAASPHIINAGKRYYVKSLISAQTHSAVSSLYGKTHGLNEVKGGFTTGLRHARAGKQFINSFMGR